jgi:fibronectin-binding autotransporter adhesin
LPGAIAILSGEISNTGKQAALATGNLFLRSMHDPFNAMLCVSNCGGGAVSLREMASNKPSVTRALPSPHGKWFGWSTVDIGQTVTNGSAATASNKTTITPVSAATGLEYRVNDRVAYGFALSGGAAGYSIANGLGSGSNQAALIGVYGRLTTGDYLLSASLYTGWQGVETKRTVFTENLGGKTDGVALGSRVEISRRLGAFSPYAALQAQTFRLNGYSEKGLDGSAATAALSYGAQTANSLRSEFGVGGEIDVSTMSRLNFRLGWAHEFANPVSTQATLAGAYGFSTTGATGLRDSLLLKSGYEHMLTSSLKIKAGLTGEFSGQSRMLAADAALKWAW